MPPATLSPATLALIVFNENFPVTDRTQGTRMIRTPIIDAFIYCLLATVMLGGAMLVISPLFARAHLDQAAPAGHLINR